MLWEGRRGTDYEKNRLAFINKFVGFYSNNFHLTRCKSDDIFSFYRKTFVSWNEDRKSSRRVKRFTGTFSNFAISNGKKTPMYRSTSEEWKKTRRINNGNSLVDFTRFLRGFRVQLLRIYEVFSSMKTKPSSFLRDLCIYFLPSVYEIVPQTWKDNRAYYLLIKIVVAGKCKFRFF